MEEIEGDLVKRFQNLEASQAKIKEQLSSLVNLGRQRDEGESTSQNSRRRRGRECKVVIIPGYFASNPYQSILQHIGHALHICRPATGEILYWNQSAESLYGWKDYEAIGQKVTTLLVDEQKYPFFEKFMENLRSGQTWSGQFPFRKRSGEMFMAIVTTSPLYENGELIGVITISNDSAILNETNTEKSKLYCNEAQGQQRESKSNFKRVQFCQQPPLASSISNLALKTFFQLHMGLRAIEAKIYTYEKIMSNSNPQSKIAAKVFSKLSRWGNTNQFQESDEGIQTTTAKKLETESFAPMSPNKCAVSTSSQDHGSTVTLHNSNQVCGCVEDYPTQSLKTAECCALDFHYIQRKTCQVRPDRWNNDPDRGSCCDESRIHLSTGKKDGGTCLKKRGKDDANHEQEKFKEGLLVQDLLPKQHMSQKREENYHSSTSRISVETNGSRQAGSSPVGEKEPNLSLDCGIRWEDLLLGAEIGEGSYAVVYRGIWNGSDVAIKAYLRKDYQEGLLLDYRKEISIMKRLRHPNVLLYMGAVYSSDRLAIVTEFLPRGSLFRALHKNNQKLDLKRRLRMALDVARGMNYLHRRNPPIIHRDLKSSNLLVDKNWTVKVGDFGLSCLKISTVSTTTSGRGTPQWMAPEVLRGECSNEKSDVFSFGVILWELMTERVPWSQLNPLQVVGVVGFMDRRLELPEGIDPRVTSIIRDCWESDPGRRPSFQELVGQMVNLVGAVTATLARRRSEHRPQESPSNSE